MSSEQATSDLEVDPASVAEWMARDGELQVVDVREPYERDAGHIEGTRHVELVRLSEQAGTFERERPIIFYCRVGSRSQMAAQAFRASGFEAYSLAGGILRWVEEGRPLSPSDGHVADH